MRVLYFGTYERNYPRNAQVISCLRRTGIDVAEHHVPIWSGREHKLELGPLEAARLALGELRLLRRPRVEFDALIVGYPGHLDSAAARRVAGDRPVVFNPLVSLEDTLVDDRQLVHGRSLRARVIRVVDRRAFRGADLIVADTATHAQFFVNRFGLPRNKVAVCFVGADDELFTPDAGVNRGSEVLFVGKLIPLHGLETIVGAAARCPDLTFRVVGSGQHETVLSTTPRNVRWDAWVDYRSLPELYRSAGCALGVFGMSDKASRVIPNKVFQALATATPVITADTTAARELLEHGRDALLVPPGDEDALAAAVRQLTDDEGLRSRLAEGGRSTYVKRASEGVLGRQWRSLLESLVEPTTPSARQRTR